MVKGFDLTKNDPSKLVLDYLFGYFEASRKLAIEEAHEYILHWLKTENSTSKIYKMFKQQKIKPIIHLINECNKESIFSYVPQQNDQLFPASQSQNKITICLNLIRNKVELKENVDRQLFVMYEYSKASNQENDEDKQKSLMKSLYLGCMQGYENYGFQTQIKQQLSKKCAKYLFRRRSQSKLPIDSLFRYSAKLADDICI